MQTESFFLLVGLFLLLGASGWVIGRFGERDEDEEPHQAQSHQHPEPSPEG